MVGSGNLANPRSVRDEQIPRIVDCDRAGQIEAGLKCGPTVAGNRRCTVSGNGGNNSRLSVDPSNPGIPGNKEIVSAIEGYSRWSNSGAERWPAIAAELVVSSCDGGYDSCLRVDLADERGRVLVACHCV